MKPGSFGSITLLISGLLLLSCVSWAAGPKDNVLDFEGDVVEGERKSPDIFIQLEEDKPRVQGVYFKRADFNDFHRVDHMRRPLVQIPQVQERRRVESPLHQQK